MQLALSIITSIAAIIALFISVWQIFISNKHALFERRLAVYLKIRRLIELCNENKKFKESYIKDKNEPLYAINMLYIAMTNNIFLESAQTIIENILVSEHQRIYLMKMEEFSSLSTEVTLIFPKKISINVAKFILNYKEMLVSMYKYIVCLNSLEKEADETSKPIRSNSLENRCRKDTIDKIIMLFNDYNKIANNLENN